VSLPRAGEQRVVPFHQQVEVRVLDDELHRVAEAERRRIVGEGEDPGDGEELGLHLADDLLHRPGAGGPVLQVGKDDPPAHPIPDVHHAEVALDALGLGQDRLGLPLVAVGVGQRGPFGRDDEVEEPAAILRRDELPLEAAKGKHRPDRHRDREADHRQPVAQSESQGPGVSPRQAVEALLESPIEHPVTGWHPQDLGAEHRRQGERHEARDDHRARDGDAELVEQAPGRPLEEGERGEHRHQGDGGGEHREGDLPGAVGGRRVGTLAQLLLVPVRVLQHDDRVVHHDADRERKREQGEVVDREAQEVHDREGGHDGRGNREAGDDRGAEIPEEDEDDHHHQSRGDEQGLLGLLDRPLDEDRLVESGVDVDAGRERLLDPGQLRPDQLGHRDDVGLGLPHHADRDRRRPLVAQGAPLVLRPQLDPAQIAQLDQHPVGVAHHQIGELLRSLELPQRPDGELAPLRLDAARRHLDVAAPDGLLDVLDGEPPGRELGGVEPHPHREAALAEDAGLAYPGQRLQPALHQSVADIGELEQVVVRARERQPEERLRVGVLFGDDRLLDIFRQALAHPGHLVTGVLGGGLHVAIEVEFEGDVADALLARAGEGSESLYRAELLLEDVGDRGFHDLWVGAGQHRAHRDDGRIHIGELAHRQLEVPQRTEEHEGQAQHAGEHRPTNRQVRKLHRVTCSSSAAY
jgi:hypothetical protein